MSTQILVSQMFTQEVSDEYNIFAAFPSVLCLQLFLFHNLAKFPSGHSCDECLLLFSRRCSSALTTSNLTVLLLPGTGPRPFTLSIASDRPQPARPYTFLHNFTHGPNTRRSTMKESNRNIYFLWPDNSPASRSSAEFGGNNDSNNVSQIKEPQQISFSTGSGGKPESVSFSPARCSEKGCVFPASPHGGGKCSYHLHQQEEPVLFRSHQPTGLLLDPARTTPRDSNYGGSRKRDRRRMAAIWEQFQNEGMS
jgi:hypothetical protein